MYSNRAINLRVKNCKHQLNNKHPKTPQGSNQCPPNLIPQALTSKQRTHVCIAYWLRLGALIPQALAAHTHAHTHTHIFIKNITLNIS